MPFAYLIFNKPYGVLSVFTDSSGRPTLQRYVSIPNVYAAGRLDFKSEGLLLLTDDGNLIHRLTDPRFEHPKTYLVLVEGQVLSSELDPIRSGLPLSGVKTRPAYVAIVPEPDLPPRPVPVRAYHPTTWLKIVLREGKKHQVRRMTAAIGYPTLRLVRVAIGPISIEGLKPGDWRFLSTGEINRIKYLRAK